MLHQLYNNTVTIDFKEKNHSYYLIQEDGKKKRLKGVTSIIGKTLAKPALIPWAVNKTVEYISDNLEILQSSDKISHQTILYGASKAADKEKQKAADIRTQIHEWIEQFATGKTPDKPPSPAVCEGINSFMEWKQQHNVVFLSAERVVYSKKYGYVGTLDLEAEIEGKRCLIDIKTGNAVYPEVRLQTAGYVKADEEERNIKYEGRYVLRISKETEDEYIERMKIKGKTDYPAYEVFEFINLDKEYNIDTDFEAFKSCLLLSNWQKNTSL